ncbi:MAG: ATP-dependent transcriptional regulator, MalT-like, LuxR family [Thermomicrobiales bacterium]|nr:ATP-dependent transcriptional regulator, MalT-like, LuxR family [Thermomicrobiales bacterium]
MPPPSRAPPAPYDPELSRQSPVPVIGELLRLETGEVVDSALAKSVQASVGGWPAAIRLIAYSRSGSEGVRPREAAGERQEQLLLDYLGDEVLTRLLPHHRHLLLRASLVERFNVPLLETLATVGGIPGLSETWFAFHPLFREILGDELARTTDAGAVSALHWEIASWFGTAGLTRDAVHHFVEAGEIPGAAALIESRLNAAFAREDWQEVASWLRLIPAETVLERPAGPKTTTTGGSGPRKKPSRVFTPENDTSTGMPT